MRDAAGLTSRQAAALLGTNPAQMSQIEAGNAGVSGERVRKLGVQYASADMELVDALVEMATDRTRGWWEEYRDVLPPVFQDLAELEHHATFMRVVGTVHVPGLLQTQEYARAVFAYVVPELPVDELDLRVRHRMRRKLVLSERTVPYEAVIHESVLRTRVADRRVAVAQLDELLSQSERPNVSLRVIPFGVDGFAGAGAMMLYAGGRVPALDTVQRDAPYGSVFLDASAQLLAMRTLFRRVESAALPPAKSRDYIHRLTKEL
ncbi:transcriptional regulator [Streptomyces avermitilis]|uniref:Transcriptional regulator n=1 Tax=Streptomyces avermitilis TaxID=33903 RepID=A0A4D4M0D7_STRAX|nr:transcriptional regulator [Streptomyces avermitilis]GDY64443.1 transcriptional regulator [Streptomyces avermitilis]GDY75386.1 transcriptional regulator [Streptomyces avermitilis]GDY84381.1 transcriptional regulator [Streptomyces avermitilis]